MFREEVLQGSLALAPFTDGYDSDWAMFYDTLQFRVVRAKAIPKNLRDINKVSLVLMVSSYTSHTYNIP